MNENPRAITLPDAKAIADLARLVVLAADEHAPEELIAERYQMLRYALPDNHLLAGTLALHNRPEYWRNISLSIANLALREASGQDITLAGVDPEIREVIKQYLAKREAANPTSN